MRYSARIALLGLGRRIHHSMAVAVGGFNALHMLIMHFDVLVMMRRASRVIRLNQTSGLDPAVIFVVDRAEKFSYAIKQAHVPAPLAIIFTTAQQV